jgi:hypothetical protein
MAISDELKAIYATAPVDRYYIETLTLTHPIFIGAQNLLGELFMTNQRDAFLGTLEDDRVVRFEPVPFTAIPPNAEEQSDVQLQVGIDNASRNLMEYVERLGSTPNVPIIVTYRVFLNDDLTVQNDPPLVLDIISVKATQQLISFTAGNSNQRDKPFPAQLYTTTLYPGLAR